MDETLKDIVNSAGIIFIGLFFAKGLNYLYKILIAHWLGTTNYGLISIGFAIVSLIGALTLVGLNMGILRYVPFYHLKKDSERVKGTILSGIKITLIISCIATALLLFFTENISMKVFHNENLIPILLVLAFYIPISNTTNIFLETLRAFKQTKFVIICRDIIQPFSKILITAILLYLGFKTLGASIAYPLSFVITLIIAFYFIQKKTFPILNKTIKSISTSKELLIFSWPLMISSLLYAIINLTDTLILGYIKSETEVGIYNAALPTANLLLAIPFALTFLFLPIITELYTQNNKTKIKETYNTILRWILLINLPLLLILIIFPSQFLGFFFGKDFISGYQSLIILAIGNFIYAFLYTSTELLKVIKKTKLILVNNIIAAILNLILNIILIQKYGMIGGAIATTVSFTLYSILCYIQTYKFIPIVGIKHLLKIIAVAILTFFITTKIYIYSNNLILAILSLGLSYLLLALIFKCYKEEDIEIIKNLLKKIHISHNN